LYAKLFFSTNKIPGSADDSDAYHRRNIILSFPDQFEEGKIADPDLPDLRSLNLFAKSVIPDFSGQ
jgi:phage/plasmid-associated DNA primase